MFSKHEKIAFFIIFRKSFVEALIQGFSEMHPDPFPPRLQNSILKLPLVLDSIGVQCVASYNGHTKKYVEVFCVRKYTRLRPQNDQSVSSYLLKKK